MTLKEAKAKIEKLESTIVEKDAKISELETLNSDLSEEFVEKEEAHKKKVSELSKTIKKNDVVIGDLEKFKSENEEALKKNHESIVASRKTAQEYREKTESIKAIMQDFYKKVTEAL